MADPTLTLVIPAYNEESSLASFLPEVIDRTERNGWQLVVVDDGSTDGTATILERL